MARQKNGLSLQSHELAFKFSCGSKNWYQNQPWQVETWAKTGGLPLRFNFGPHPNGAPKMTGFPLVSPFKGISLASKRQAQLSGPPQQTNYIVSPKSPKGYGGFKAKPKGIQPIFGGAKMWKADSLRPHTQQQRTRTELENYRDAEIPMNNQIPQWVDIKQRSGLICAHQAAFEVPYENSRPDSRAAGSSSSRLLAKCGAASAAASRANEPGRCHRQGRRNGMTPKTIQAVSFKGTCWVHSHISD